MFAVMFLLSENVSAMTFSQPVKIGEIGFPIQSPYHYLLVNGASYNSGTPFKDYNNKLTYKEGIAVFGNGEDKLFCEYSLNKESKFIKFGGQNNYIVSLDCYYRRIYKIATNEGLTLYSIEQTSGSERINIIGRLKDGKWFSYVDSDVLTDKYFNGLQSYKHTDGVHYNMPKFDNDTIIIPYKYQLNFKIAYDGELRFKWDDKAQWFSVENVVY